MEIVSGNVVDISPDGYIIVRAALPNIDRALIRHYDKIQMAGDK